MPGTRPRMLDLFCKAGGAAMGYYRAGFDVVGVDIEPQPRYPFEFHQADALTFPLDGFDAIHASPPCQAWSTAAGRGRKVDPERYPKLIEPTRERLRAAGVPYVIENVAGAPLRNPIRLCGSSFGLNLQRHRLFDQGLTIKRPGERPDWTGEVRCLPERLDVPLRRRKPTTYFVDSMSDLFHPGVPMDFVLNVWETMSRCPQHTFQILTKRPQRAAKIVSAIAWDWDGDDKGGVPYAWPGPQSWWRPTEADLNGGGEEPLPNVWLGTSIGTDKYTFRADHLRATPAAVRFLSLEPLLGPLPSLDLTGIDWVIVGGESGPGARPMHTDWVRDIRDRCIAAGVPFFFKQWGSWREPETAAEWHRPGQYLHPDGSSHPWPGEWHIGTGCAAVVNLGTKAAGRELDGRTWAEMPGTVA